MTQLEVRDQHAKVKGTVTVATRSEGVRPRGLRGLTCVAVLASVSLGAASASAYNARKVEKGGYIQWHAEKVRIVIDPQMEEQLGKGALTAAKAAFQQWSAVTDAFPPELQVEVGAVDDPGYRSDAVNTNTVRYMPEGFDKAGKALGVTLVTYDAEGKILDADIILNGGEERPFALVDSTVEDKNPQKFDAQNVLTHEAGHFFGFGEENEVEEATMYPSSQKGETKKRDLSATDEDGLRLVYAEAAGEGPTPVACAAPSSSLFSKHSWQGSAVAIAMLGLVAARSKKRKSIVAGAGVALAVAAVPAGFIESSQQMVRTPSDLAQVTATRSHWENGIIVTETDVDVRSCVNDTCAVQATSFEVLGGGVDGIYQVVGHEPAPSVGQVVPVVRGDDGEFRFEKPILTRRRVTLKR